MAYPQTKRFISLMLILGAVLCSSAVLITAAGAKHNPNLQSNAPTQQKPDPELVAKLLKVKRICVDSFGEDADAKQIQALVMNALAESNRFIITEAPSRADAILKGISLTEAPPAGRGGAEPGPGRGGSRGGPSAGGNEGDAVSSDSRQDDRRAGKTDSAGTAEADKIASVAVRLVSPDGDVIWTARKESKGTKDKSASADVADMVVKQLLLDFDSLAAGAKQKN
jgi:hypothetical protein